MTKFEQAMQRLIDAQKEALRVKDERIAALELCRTISKQLVEVLEARTAILENLNQAIRVQACLMIIWALGQR